MNLFREIGTHSGKTAAIDENGTEYSFHDLINYADRSISRLDHSQKSLAFILTKNSFASLASYVGLLRASHCILPLNHTIHEHFLQELIEKYRPRFVFFPVERSDLFRDKFKLHEFNDYCCIEIYSERDYRINDQLALLVTTSGSTGSPRLVMQTYKNILSNGQAIAQYLSIEPSDRAITTLPMSYVFGQSILHSHLLQGASVVLTESSIVNRKFWDLFNDMKVTSFSGVPYTYEILKKLKFEKMDLPHLKYMTQAGGKLDPGLALEFIDFCEKRSAQFIMMYGQSEATARISYLPWEYVRSKLGSIGVPIPGGDLFIEDEHGMEVKRPYFEGELVYKGANVSMGLANTRFDLEGPLVKPEILRTGDLGYKDKDGFFYIIGRKNRFIKIFGNRINLSEVEDRMKEHGVECLCIGSDKNIKFFLTDPGHVEISRMVALEKLGLSKNVISFQVLNEFPRNESGKIEYYKLESFQ